MLYPTTRCVFDRKKTASKEKRALVQIEVLFGKKKKYISTNVYVYQGEWSKSYGVCHRLDAKELNDRIQSQKQVIDGYINQLIISHKPFDFAGLVRFLDSGSTEPESFLDFVSRRIVERPNITAGTRKNHRKLLNSLMAFDQIHAFLDLTPANVRRYYEWLRQSRDGKVLRPSTVHSYMKFLRLFIHDAIHFEFLTSDPTIGMKIPRGEHDDSRWLNAEEVATISSAELNSERLSRVRDLFVFQCYTGLSYSDLMNLDKGKLEVYDGVQLLSGNRIKTGEEYNVVIMPEAKAIIERYDYSLPHYSLQKYNDYLKLLATAAKIDKPLSSHWGRRTCGYMMARKGYSIEVIARVLGHSDIKTTQAVYARYMKDSVVREYRKIEKKSSRARVYYK